jgi:hypothetical protein
MTKNGADEKKEKKKTLTGLAWSKSVTDRSMETQQKKNDHSI